MRNLDSVAGGAPRACRAFMYQLVVAGRARAMRATADTLEALRSWGLPVEPHWTRCAGIDDVIAFCHEWAGHAGDRSSSTPTASSSRWTTWRCASGSARRRSFRAGRRRSSSRRSRRHEAAGDRASTSAGPARSRRTPCSSRSSSPARRSRWRRCTTPRTSRARTCARATRVVIEKGGDVIPKVVTPILEPAARTASRGRCRRPVPCAAASCSATKKRSSGAARTRRARRGCAAASSTSPRGRR